MTLPRSHMLTAASALPLGLAWSGPAFAQVREGQLDLADSGDTAWLIAATLIALLGGLGGLALFHGGRARAGNAVSVVLQIGAIAALVSLLWMIAGYTLAFGDVASGWVGSGNAWMLIQLGNVREGTGVPESTFALFQLSFALLAPALMTGAWAGRARFGWVLLFTALWSLIVYAPVAHWIWGGGWLAARIGTQDWSGGLVVQTTAGVSALVAALMIGPRRDGDTGTPPSPALALRRSPALALVGALLLWLGALAQSGGYALAATDDASAAMIATHAAAMSAALVWILLERIFGGRPSATGLTTGLVAGLAAIAASAGFVSPGGAMLIGALAAIAGRGVLVLIRDTLRIGDTLSIFAVHGIGGLLGALLAGPFMAETLGGTGYRQGSGFLAQSLAQAVGAGVVVAWSVIGTLILGILASFFFAMRVSEDAERAGLDLVFHDERRGDLD